mmetsp:Transcript_8210/g.36623  ORF Transcript_8210/g.36623 Transcript_8210/m.36623 type:complete len:172 (+) Transcript_8210:844-1359(+)
MTSFLAGGVASLSSQAIVVPVDVVSQRLMVSTRAQGKTHGGLQEVRKLLAADGFKGLYRGFGISLMTYVPSSAVWWSAYAAYKEIFFQSVFGPKGSSRRENVGDESQPNSVNNESPSNESNGLVSTFPCTSHNPLASIAPDLETTAELVGSSPLLSTSCARELCPCKIWSR